MSDAKESKKGERLEPVPDRVSSPDAQAARAAGAGDIASVEKQRTNASDGSLRRYNPANLAAQEHSIELVYDGRTASRTEKKTERELLREMANKPENSTTQDLESIAKDKSLPEDKRTLAEMIQEMRTQSKALGAPTDALDAYAREALQAELLAKSKTQLPQSDDQDSCGSFSYTDAKKGMTIGSHTYAADQLIAQGDVQSPVVSDATNARAADLPHERTLLFGHVSEPDPWDKVAALPEKTQAEIVLTAIRAHAEHWGREQAQRAIGSLMGATEGVGQILQDMATITDFNHACLTGDTETAANMGAAFGDSLGRMLVGGVNFLKISDDYLQDLGAQGDWTKPVKDLARLGQTLNAAWAELSPMEQERLKSRFITEFAANALMPETSVRLLKAGKFTEVLPNMVKIAAQSGSELKQLPGDIKKVRQGFSNFFDDMFAPEAVTPDGRRIKMTSEVKQHYLMNQADDSAGLGHSKDVRDLKSGISSEKAPEHLNWLTSERTFIKDREIPVPEGLKIAQMLREDLRSSCKDIDYRNIAVVEIDIPGLPEKMAAVHGKFSPPGTVGKPVSPFFQSFPSGYLPRSSDSEYKILDDVAHRLIAQAQAKGIDPKQLTGTLLLFSEQMPCPRSCQKVIAKFRQDFPAITFPEPTWAFKTEKLRHAANVRGVK